MAMPRSFGSSQVTFLPPIQICPPETSSRPAMQLSRVDLPQPDGPSRTMNSPSATSRSSFSSTAPRRRSSQTPGWRRSHRLPMITPSPRRRRCRARKACRTGSRRAAGRARSGWCGHVDVVFLHALYRVDDVVELHRHRQVLAAGEDHDAEQEVVPDAGDLQDDGDDQDRQSTSAA
jgi:hypothetical protein